VTVHGIRRYRRAGVRALAESAGLRVRRVTYAYSFLAPLAAVLAKVERRTVRAGAGATSDVERRSLDRVLAPLAGVERRWLARHDLPLGTSVALVATRS
jgi:hypothetical protein